MAGSSKKGDITLRVNGTGLLVRGPLTIMGLIVLTALLGAMGTVSSTVMLGSFIGLAAILVLLVLAIG